MPPRKRTPQTPTDAPTPIKGIEAPDRFLGAASALEGLVEAADGIDLGIVFEIIRPDDLVALTIRAVNCELVKRGRTPQLEAGADALLIVTHPYQHAYEEAQVEQVAPQPDKYGSQVPPPTGDPNPYPEVAVTQPAGIVGYIPARRSRVVFRIPEGETIEFSSKGVLEAMTRLEMAVHRLATPGTPGLTGSAPDNDGFIIILPPIIHLGDGLILEQLGSELRISSPPKTWFRSNPAPDTSTPVGAAFQARELQRARELMANVTPVIAPRTKFPIDGEFIPGGPWIPEIPGPIRYFKGKSNPPSATETAIEAPYRLIISPDSGARWSHAIKPVRNPNAEGHVELWHSRLSGPPPRRKDRGPLEEKPDFLPVIAPKLERKGPQGLRAIWARDRDGVPNWQLPDSGGTPVAGLGHADEPWVASLDRFDRHMLVRQTSETWEGEKNQSQIAPAPFGADALWLSGLGAWLDFHGAWNTKPYSNQGLGSIMVWDHVAPMGRDQYVRVVYPGYLVPVGHQAALVKVTERKMKMRENTKASLYQRMFIVIGERSRTWGLSNPEQRQFPFERVDIRPLVTPPIDRPAPIDKISKYFWPRVANQDFRFVVDAWDREHRQVRFATPLMWVAEAFDGFAELEGAYAGSGNRKMGINGQPVSFVPRDDDPDTELQTESIYLLGRAMIGRSEPRMSAAQVQIPAVQKLNPQDGPMPIRYFDKYLNEGLNSSAPGRVWATTLGPGSTAQGSGLGADPLLSQMPSMGFGGSGAPSDRTGGFVAPSLPLAAISRDGGPVGDPVNVANNDFQPAQFLAGVDAKLFGIVDLWELIPPDTLLNAAPAFVTETLGRIQAFLATLQRLKDQVIGEIERQAKYLEDRANAMAETVQAQVQRAQDAKDAADVLAGHVIDLFDEATDLIKFPGSPLANLDPAAAQAELADVSTKLNQVMGDLDTVAGYLPPEAAQLAKSIKGALEDVADITDSIDDILAFVQGFDPAKLQLSMKFEWAPKLADWPDDATALVHFIPKNNEKRNLSLRVEGKVTATGEMKAEAVAEIRDLELRLFGAEPLIVFPIHHMYFKAGSSGKPEIDVALGDLQFLNELSFIETIKDLIPFDGFSDPPFVDVDASGATAGFTLELPNIAVGVFNLSNISLGADVHVPFLGDIVTAGFNFCTRERPFSLTVMCLGGGGWFGLRVSPEGLEILELGLEAQACLAVDFGVASGSISAAVGVYLRLEGETGSLTGYFRLRGEVDVLGLISASIELYMSLTYETHSGKMIGRAKITVEVDVLCFSGSVSIEAERRLAGSNGDPSFREILGAESGTSPYWSTYCDAFAGE